MSNLERLPDEVSVPIKPEADGYLGRECPVKDCGGYFKITPGTGLTGNDLPCHCPYCGHAAGGEHFFTQEQIEYAHSIVFNMFSSDVFEDLRALEFNHRPSGPFGFGISMKVEGEPEPIQYYREKQLETEVACDQCTLRYAIYGVFGHCPDCGVHNSAQILAKNLDVADKMLVLAAGQQADLADRLVGDALGGCVSAFDGFGRETCRVKVTPSSSSKPKKISFQNLSGSRTNVQEQFGFDLAVGLSPDEWTLAHRCFQKRHLLAHKMGVVDEDYLRVADDPRAVIGRKVRVTPNEVQGLIAVLRKLGNALVAGMKLSSPLSEKLIGKESGAERPDAL